MIKYLVVGGIVRSQTDGDLHYISPQKLCRLYNVDQRVCFLIKSMEDVDIAVRTLPDIKMLTVRYFGDYQLPESEKDQQSA